MGLLPGWNLIGRSVGLLAWTGRQTAQKQSGLISPCRKFCLHLTSDRSKSVGSISSPVPRRALTWCRVRPIDAGATGPQPQGGVPVEAVGRPRGVLALVHCRRDGQRHRGAGSRRRPSAVIQLVHAVPITIQRGTNYAPLFKLVCWVEPDETVFGPRTVAPPGGAPIVVQASPSSHNLASVATPHACRP